MTTELEKCRALAGDCADVRATFGEGAGRIIGYAYNASDRAESLAVALACLHCGRQDVAIVLQCVATGYGQFAWAREKEAAAHHSLGREPTPRTRPTPYRSPLGFGVASAGMCGTFGGR